MDIFFCAFLSQLYARVHANLSLPWVLHPFQNVGLVVVAVGSYLTQRICGGCQGIAAVTVGSTAGNGTAAAGKKGDKRNIPLSPLKT